MQTGLRILGEDGERRRSPRTGLKKVQFGERAFLLQEFIESDYDQEELFEIEEVNCNVFAAMDKSRYDMEKGTQSFGKKKEKNYNKKPCPIKCSKETHSNGSLFFCKAFRNKSEDERRSLVKKTHVCMTCLAKTGSNHVCSVGSCKNCGGGHNILLCPKEAKVEDNARMVAENNDTDSDPDDDYTEDENQYERNDSEHVFLVRKDNPKTSTPKGSGKTRPQKEGDKETKAKTMSLQEVEDRRKLKVKRQEDEVTEEKTKKTERRS